MNDTKTFFLIKVIDTKKGTWYPPVLRRPRDLSLTCFDIEGAQSTQHWSERTQ